MSDTISRQAAIDAINSIDNLDAKARGGICINLIGLPSAEPEQRWILCSERLPEDEYVLISKKPTKISGDKWCVTIAIRMEDTRSRKVKWMDIGFGEIPDDKVLAWMPLPDPYREEGGE